MSKQQQPFVNPLLQRSMPASTTEGAATTLVAPAPPQETAPLATTLPATLSSTPTSTSVLAEVPDYRKRGKQAFDRTHTRMTIWVRRDLERAFVALATTRGMSKTALLNEALADLLTKDQRMSDHR